MVKNCGNCGYGTRSILSFAPNVILCGIRGGKYMNEKEFCNKWKYKYDCHKEDDEK